MTVFFSHSLKWPGEVKQDFNVEKMRWGTPQHVHKAEAAEAFRYSPLKLLAIGSLSRVVRCCRVSQAWLFNGLLGCCGQAEKMAAAVPSLGVSQSLEVHEETDII